MIPAPTSEPSPSSGNPDEQNKLFVSMLTDVKTDLLLKCAQLDVTKELETRINELEVQVFSGGPSNPKSQVDDLESSLEAMKTFPKMLQALQVQIMRTDTNMFDLQRTVTHCSTKITEFGLLESEIKEQKEAV